jgi:ubiquinone/menaquinone biosynthesis C-methylase UbiE
VGRRGTAATRQALKTIEAQSFEPFAKEAAYIRVNQKLVARLLNHLAGRASINLLDVAAGTGLITSLTFKEAKSRGVDVRSTLLDLDLPALRQARLEVSANGAGYVFASADRLPFKQEFDAALFANALHLLDDDAKNAALREIHRVLQPHGVFAVNSTFYDGAYPEESKPFYSRWIRRAITEINQRIPNRTKSEKVQAMTWLSAEDYKRLLECNGFRVVELRERRVLLSQAAVRAISSYKEFAKGALHATEADAEEAARALQVTVQRTFRELGMKTLPRNWLEIIATRA